MRPLPSDVSLRLIGVDLTDCGPFRGSWRIALGPQRTVIVGKSGSGLTTLARAMVGRAPGATLRLDGRCADSVLEMCAGLVLLDGRLLTRTVTTWALSIPVNDWRAVRIHAFRHFTELVGRPCDRTPPERMLGQLAFRRSAEHVCWQLASVLAARHVYGLDLPLVLDRPFGGLEDPLRYRALRLVERSASQIVHLLAPHEYDGDWPVDYVLRRGRTRTEVVRR